MTRLVATPRFRFDTNEILNYLEKVAGRPLAEKYSSRIDQTIVRLATFPESGAPRPALGAHARVALVPPYLLIYDYTPTDELLILLRLLHGRRNITAALLRR
jgi:toxin ParE1/3/4